MNQKIKIIAIDGHAGTGKSTLAKKLAKKLGYLYIDTGAMFRALTYYALQQGYFKDNASVAKIERAISRQAINIEFRENPEARSRDIFLNGVNISDKITNRDVSEKVSQVAKIPAVRTFLLELQRRWASKQHVILDGRDIGTVVFPNATHKFFITVPIEIRAKRRHEQLLEKGENISYKSVFDNIKKRDYEDENRALAPLKKAEDALTIDNGQQGIEAMVTQLYGLIKNKA